MLRGADPPRALRVTALANLCPCFAPVCPQGGRPGSKDRAKNEPCVEVCFTPPLRYSVKPLFWLGHDPCKETQGSRPRTRPPPRVRDCCTSQTLPRSHPPWKGSPAVKKEKRGGEERKRRRKDDVISGSMLYAPPGPCAWPRKRARVRSGVPRLVARSCCASASHAPHWRCGCSTSRAARSCASVAPGPAGRCPARPGNCGTRGAGPFILTA